MKPEIIVRSDGTKQWYLHGKRHRDDGPAIICSNGTKMWYLNGKCHRKDGPAVIYHSGRKEWWINGELQFGHIEQPGKLCVWEIESA